jgi:Xaa-Pro aminopeptidase
MGAMYAQHRQRLLERLAKDRAAAVVPTATPKVRNHDCDYRFRPDSDFWYLTGFAEPGACLVLLPPLEDGQEARSVLYLRELDKQMEIWNGRRLGVAAAPDALGVDEARDIEDLWEDLPELLLGYERILWRLGAEAENDRRMVDVVSALRGKARGGIRPPAELVDHVPYLHEQRLRKTEHEAALMRAAAAITTEAHLAAMRETRPGMGENEVDALIEYTFKRRGSTGPAYNNIVAGGANACILHYVENDQELQDGDLLLIDAGAEKDYYASDVTRTFPVSGTFSEPQRAIYELVLRAQKAAIDHVRPGVGFDSVHEVALNELVDGLISLGLCEGTRESVIEDGSFRAFFMHRTGHWLGLDVHDCGYYAVEGSSRLLEPGMALTVEPGLYVDPENDEVDAKWRGIGVRIEDDLLVTESGHENLTAGIPKEVEEVEAACAGVDLAATRA